MTSTDTPTRPRVEGEREREVLDAALVVLAEVGYDRLTMDSVAQRARASKATLYRRWSTKATLVIDALLAHKQAPTATDTGTLRGDLLAAYCGRGGLTDHQETAVFASVVTAISRDTEFAEAFRRDVVGPKVALSRVIFDRARERGEIADGVDLDLLTPALAGTVMHRMFLLGETPTPESVARVVDHVILPAVTHGPHRPAPSDTAADTAATPTTTSSSTPDPTSEKDTP
jgi:AcrR family transcriptional regulator